jgi:lipopolysaccharide transport system permease protein
MNLGKLRYQFDVLRELVSRDLRLRYKRSVMGVLWSLLNPLLQLLVFTLIFGVILPLNIPNFPLFLFVGLLAWNWFQASLTEATGAIVDNRDLIRRPGFSTTILPLVPVTTNFIHLLIALPVLLVFLWWSKVPFSALAFTLPLVLAVQFVVTLSLAYVLAALNVSFRDVRYLLALALLLGFYMTPVFYDPAAIPAQYQALYHLNPLVTLIESYRDLLLYSTAPQWGLLGVVAVAGLLALWWGVRLFKHKSIHFAEEL